MAEAQFSVGGRIDLPGHRAQPAVMESARLLGGGSQCRARLVDGTTPINTPPTRPHIIHNSVKYLDQAKGAGIAGRHFGIPAQTIEAAARSQGIGL